VDLAGGQATIAVRGDLDLATTPTLAKELVPVLAARPQQLAFDLDGVDFMDCAGARLIAGAGAALPPGTRPVVRHAGPLVRRILELTGLAGHCDLDAADATPHRAEPPSARAPGTGLGYPQRP